MPVARRRPARTAHYASGPWSGVFTTDDPFDSGPATLIDATNCYIPDVDDGSGVYARPGFSQLNGGDPLVTSAAPFRGQGVITHTDLDGVTYNFVVFNGALFREDEALASGTDVTPAGITIDAGLTTRVYGTGFANTLVITDGVHRPWLATDLASTPITGTYIDFDSAGGSWAAFGPARLYAGSFFFILAQVGGVSARTDIAWSSPGDAATGYQQTDFDFRWTLGQTEADPLYALYGTNVALLYWREHSIGAISGTPGPDLQTTHTDDSVSKNVGTIAPQSIIAFGTILYFTDAIGRPYRLQPGSDPEPIWLQMRGIIGGVSVGFSGVTKSVTTAAYESTMSVYIVMVWSPVPAQLCPTVQGYTFDARTGRYFGRFQIADGVQVDTLGSFTDSNGRSLLIALGSILPPTDAQVQPSGYVWGIRSLEAIGTDLATEAGVLLTTEDAVQLTTEGTQTTNWLDGDQVPVLSVTTPRFGYEIDSVIAVDRAAVLTGGGSPIAVSATTASVAQTVEGTPTPSTTQDGVGRATVGFNGIQGRGVTLTVSPTTALSQFIVQGISVDGVLSRANPDEP